MAKRGDFDFILEVFIAVLISIIISAAFVFKLKDWAKERIKELEQKIEESKEEEITEEVKAKESKEETTKERKVIVGQLYKLNNCGDDPFFDEENALKVRVIDVKKNKDGEAFVLIEFESNKAQASHTFDLFVRLYSPVDE